MSDTETCSKCGVTFRYLSFERIDVCPDCEYDPGIDTSNFAEDPYHKLRRTVSEQKQPIPTDTNVNETGAKGSPEHEPSD